MSSPHQPHQPSDVCEQPPTATDARPVEPPESDRAREQKAQGLVITAFIMAGVALLLMVPFPPIGALLALGGAFVGFRARRRNTSDRSALIAMIISAAIGALNLVILVVWIGGISQVLQEL